MEPKSPWDPKAQPHILTEVGNTLHVCTRVEGAWFRLLHCHVSDNYLKMGGSFIHSVYTTYCLHPVRG